MDKHGPLNCYENKPKIQKQSIFSAEKTRNSLSKFMDSEIHHENFKPWITHDSEEANKGISDKVLDILLINNNEWKSLHSEKIKTPESFSKKRTTDFRAWKSHSQNAKCAIKTETLSSRPNYAVNVYSLCEILKKIKSDDEKISDNNSSPKLIDVKILENIKKCMSSKEILKLTIDGRSNVSPKLSEFKEIDKKTVSKPNLNTKIENIKEDETDYDKNKLFLQEVLGILTENEKKEIQVEESKISQNFLSNKDNYPEYSEKTKKITSASQKKLARGYKSEHKIKQKKISSPSINKFEKEIITLKQNNNSFRLDDVAKMMDNASAKNSKIIKKKKSLFLRNINNINHASVCKEQKSSKESDKKPSIKSSRTNRISDYSNNSGTTLRIHSLSTPSSIIENSPQSKPVFISPRIRPHSVFIQNFSGKIENQCKYENIAAPFCVSVRGAKVKECDSYGIMFRPSTAYQSKSSIPVSAAAIKRAIYSHRIK